MARPQGPASPALGRSQQPWAPNLPGGPRLTVMASLGKGHVAGFVAAGMAVGVGEGSEAQGRGGSEQHGTLSQASRPPWARAWPPCGSSGRGIRCPSHS